MKKLKYTAAFLLSVVLLLSALTGCGNSAASPSAEEDVTLKLAGIAKDTTLFTVDGVPVSAENFLFWVAQSADYVVSYYQNMGQEMDWETQLAGEAPADYIKNDAMSTAKLYQVVANHADEMGLTLTDEDKTDYEAGMTELVSQLGSEDNYKLWLSRLPLSRAEMDKLNQVSYLYTHIQDKLYGEGSEKAPTDETMDTYIADNHLVQTKHIILLTIDPTTGAALDDKTIAEKKKQIDDLLSQIKKSDDPTATFDTLMNKYSEDTGLSSNPDGYVYDSENNNYVAEFVDGTLALDYGEISDVVKSSMGYHILMRVDPDSESLREQYVSDQMNTLIQGWLDDAEVKTTDAYDKLDIQAYYTALIAHQAEVDAVMKAAESAAPQESSIPEESASPTK
ncbi:Foldase protein PrsA [bioreactor metagenome]|uniref:Foldase protein PrsA n=1 Tax=bioreactor metagenome TaxID=1076179 RepID=A0A644WNL3_9ZZZZ